MKKEIQEHCFPLSLSQQNILNLERSLSGTGIWSVPFRGPLLIISVLQSVLADNWIFPCCRRVFIGFWKKMRP